MSLFGLVVLIVVIGLAIWAVKFFVRQSKGLAAELTTPIHPQEKK